MKLFHLILLFFLVSQICLAQAVTNQKEAEKLYKKNDKEMNTAKQYFAEDDKCRKLISERDYSKAETSCSLLVSIAEKLPKTRYMEKYSAYQSLGVSLLLQHRPEQAVVFLNKSLEIAKPNIDDTDSESGDIYYLIGQANHLLGKTNLAREFYERAETTYRAAFKKIDIDEIREHYPAVILRILQSQIVIDEEEGLKDESQIIKNRVEETKKEFAKYLGN